MLWSHKGPHGRLAVIVVWIYHSNPTVWVSWLVAILFCEGRKSTPCNFDSCMHWKDKHVLSLCYFRRGCRTRGTELSLSGHHVSSGWREFPLLRNIQNKICVFLMSICTCFDLKELKLTDELHVESGSGSTLVSSHILFYVNLGLSHSVWTPEEDTDAENIGSI